MSRGPDFDRVAHIYRWAEYLALGPVLQLTRTHFLPELDPCRNALVLGDGDGRFLAALFRRNLGVRAVAYDTSAEMLRLLRQRCRFASSRLQTKQRSLLRITPAAKVDLIVTHFVLDCFSPTEVNRVVFAMSATKPGTLWLISDFGMPRAKALRPLARLYIRALYAAFGVLTGLRVRTLPDPQQALELAGFTRLARHERLGGFLYSELWRNNAGASANIHSEMSEPQSTHPPFDAQPDPEPAPPSLPEPDTGVYHHEVGAPQNEQETP